MQDKDFLDLRERARSIRDMYSEQAGRGRFSALVMGLRGSGKTSFVCTGPRPILIDSFDPRGTVVVERMYPEEVAKGDILIRRWWDDSTKRPRVFREWLAQWEKDIRTGFLNHVGTYAIDSYTTFQDALANMLGTQGKSAKLEPGALAQSAYQPLYATVLDVVKMTSTQDCNFILTAHTLPTQDELTGEIMIDIDAFSRMRSKLPAMFTEKYVMIVEAGASESKHYILTRPYRKYIASTQLGAGGTFDLKEPPDIKAMLRKANMPDDDKPSLFEED